MHGNADATGPLFWKLTLCTVPKHAMCRIHLFDVIRFTDCMLYLQFFDAQMASLCCMDFCETWSSGMGCITLSWTSSR